LHRTTHALWSTIPHVSCLLLMTQISFELLPDFQVYELNKVFLLEVEVKPITQIVT
jgi:hypothetical protein